MQYRINIDLTLPEMLDKVTQEMLRAAIGSIITDNIEEAEIADIRFTPYS